MWIHLNRVRSTFSKSTAETSGRFLRHKMERTEKTWHGERLARARISNRLLESLCLALTDAWQGAGSTAQASEAQLRDRPCPKLNSQPLLAPLGSIQTTAGSLLGCPFLGWGL